MGRAAAEAMRHLELAVALPPFQLSGARRQPGCKDADADADQGDVSVQDTKSLRALSWQACRRNDCAVVKIPLPCSRFCPTTPIKIKCEA